MTTSEGAEGSMNDNRVDEILRALGRVEGALEAGKAQREELSTSLTAVRTNLHSLRNDVQKHIAQTFEHERRITALEMLPPLIGQMANHGERLKSVEGRIDLHDDLLAQARGMSKAVKWVWGCVLIAAGVVSWSVQYVVQLLK